MGMTLQSQTLRFNDYRTRVREKSAGDAMKDFRQLSVWQKSHELTLAIYKESNISAIRGPERKCGSFGPSQRLCLERIERAHPHLGATRAVCCHGDVVAVGRYGKSGDAGFGRRVDGVLEHLRNGRRQLPEVDE